MNPDEINHPFEIDEAEVLSFKTFCESLVIDARETKGRFNKELSQKWIVDLRHHVIIEIRFIVAVKDLIGNPASQ